MRIVANHKELQWKLNMYFFKSHLLIMTLCALIEVNLCLFLMLFSGWVRLSMFAIWFSVSAIFSVFSGYCQQRRRLG